MYNVLIVDDEPAHRRGLTQVLNRIRPNYLLFEAKDGIDAEIIINTTHIDIVLTDIQMPNKNGLLFLQSLSEKGVETKVIIVSGYGQFEYAKKALFFGVYDFLLKPVDIEELEVTLTKTEKSLQKQSDLASRLGRMEQIYTDTLLYKLVNGEELSAEEQSQISDVMPQQAAGLIIAIRSTTKTDVLTVKKQFIEVLDELVHSLVFEISEENVQIVGFLFLRQNNIKGIPLFVRDRLQDLCKLNVTMGISDVFDDVVSDIKAAYQQAQNALLYTYYSDSGICLYNNIIYNDLLIPGILGSKEQELINAVRYADKNKIMTTLNNIFLIVSENEKPNPNRLKESFINICIRVLYILHREQDIKDYQVIISSIIKKIVDSEHYSILQKTIIELWMLLNEISKENVVNDDIITRSICFVNENFAEDLTMEDVAKRFHFTPSYYSVCFKKRTGFNFSRYITNLRIEKACHLLVKTNNKIKEISTTVGYQDPAYFGKVFKEKVGCSPDQYRKRNIAI